MKKVELLVGDYEYSQIEEIFENEPDFEPITEKDKVIIATLKQVINKTILKKKMLGAKRLTKQRLKRSSNQKTNPSMKATWNLNYDY